MTKWKVGGKAMVEIAHISANGGINLCGAGAFFIDLDALQPIPRPMTDAEAALVERMISRRLDPKCPGNRFSIETGEFVDAVIAERAPHDPLVELKALARTLIPSDRETMLAAIARLEARMKEQKQ